MLPTYNRTGWFTFFLVLTGVLPVITNLLNIISSLVDVTSGTTSFSNMLGSFLINASMLTLAVFYTKWLWETRSALILSQTAPRPVEALTNAQSSLLKYLKVSTILQIIGLSASAIGLILLFIFLIFFSQIH